MKALRTEKLIKNFGGINATNNVSFSVEEGERVALIGPNGAGKTTLFNLLGGQLTPTSGKIYFYDKDITNLSAYKRTHLGIARSFQIASLFPNLSVLENMFLAVQGTKRTRFEGFRAASSFNSIINRVEELLGQVDLLSKKDKPVHSIAYGEQRRLEIALSFASDPKLLLLDEPSCGLTATESADIIERIRRLGQKITVILVAHDMDLVFGCAQRIIVLHQGRLIVEGSCDEIKVNEKLKDIYMGDEKET